jgi:hypothetical protein
VDRRAVRSNFSRVPQSSCQHLGKRPVEKPFITIALLGSVVAVAIAGCGGGSDSSTTTTAGASGATGTPLSSDEFVKQGNAICAAGNKATNQAANSIFSGEKPTDAQLQQFADILVTSVQGQIDAIRALPAPTDEADQVTTFLDDAQSAVDEVKADPTLLAASNSNGPFADVSKEANALGLTECAN